MAASLTPRSNMLLVKKNESTILEKSDIRKETAGMKAYGLSCLPEKWTLPYFVIDSSFKMECVSNSDFDGVYERWISEIEKACASIGLVGDSEVIVRSSAINETIEHRGKYYSVSGNIADLKAAVQDCIMRLLEDAETKADSVFLILQKYVVPSEHGQLSNERRVYKEPRDWKGQIESNKRSEPFSVNLRNWRLRQLVGENLDQPLDCLLRTNIQKSLRVAAAWGYAHENRLHFEWLWSGKYLFLVQVEEEIPFGVFNPQLLVADSGDVRKEFIPKALSVISSEHAKKYRKIENVLTYSELDLPTTKLYVLEDQALIGDLAKRVIDGDLTHDLSQLTQDSLVIRVDVNTESQELAQMLPRTHEVRSTADAINWLFKHAASILDGNLDVEVAFIFHNFVPASASAFAFASPGERKVHIESSWGIPEGLYYYPHDRYVVDTGNAILDKVSANRIKISRQIRYKPYCVAPNFDGSWSTQKLGAPFDWGESIKREDWLKMIAEDSRKIAESVGSPISIMWFVGVPERVCQTPLIPWFHEAYDTSKLSRISHYRKKTPFDVDFRIETEADIEKLKGLVNSGNKMIRRVLVRPTEEVLLRDKATLKTIGELVNSIDAAVVLEGAILSHAFYQLLQCDVAVHCESVFEDDLDQQEFYKLVRDKIPAKIADAGEEITIGKLEGEELLHALKDKLVEEAIEALDSNNHDDLIEELSDVREVIDGILRHIGTQESELLRVKKAKIEKAGAFEQGIILGKTTNPGLVIPPEESRNFELDLGVDQSQEAASVEKLGIENIVRKWTDRRTHSAAEEVVVNIEIPLLLDRWETESPQIRTGKDGVQKFKAIIVGTRKGSKARIEISLYTMDHQLTLL